MFFDPQYVKLQKEGREQLIPLLHFRTFTKLQPYRSFVR